MATRGRPPKPETLVARAAVAAFQQQQTGGATPPKLTNRTIVRALYEAAGRGRRMSGWTPPASGPNRAITGLQIIRNRSRDTARNDWSGTSAGQKWTTTLIGIGITPRFKRIANKARKQQIIDLWDDHVSDCDADGVLNYYGLQTMSTRNWVEAGEVFVRRRARFLDEGLTVPVQYQVLEADMVPLLDADSYQGLPKGNKIRSGIELNNRGRRVAYWVYKEHPGDNPGKTIDPSSLVRVAASDMIHMFEPLRPGQLRGVPFLAPVLARLKNIENYDDATLTRQQLANLVVAFITRKLPPLTGDEDIDGLTGQEIEIDGEGKPLVGLQPGLVQELDDGQDVNWSNPPEAGTTYSDYMRTQHMGTAAGAGLPYELFAGDLKDVSDRTLRVMINELRRHAEQRQWQIIIHQFCRRTIEWFADAAVLAGAVSLEEYNDVRRVEWSPHGWAHIHPVQDPQGKQLEVQAGFRSRSSVIAERGDDPDMVDEERAGDLEREKALGLYNDPTGLTDANGNPVEPADPQEDDPEEQQTAALLRAMTERSQAQTELFRKQASAKPQEGPTHAELTQARIADRILDLLGGDDEQ